ncbi:MAG TPA: DMT family transporter [Acidimicrobiales bacterium]
MSERPRAARDPSHHLALAVAVLSVVFLSFGPIFVRKAEMGGLAFAFHRMWLAAAAYVVLSHLTGRPLTWQALRVSLPGGLFFAFNVATFFESVQRTSVANATVIGALQPAALLFVGGPLFGERATVREVGWTSVSIAGTAIVVFGASSAQTGDLVGDALAFAAMLGYAAYYAASKRARSTLGTLEYQSALSIIATVALVPVVLIDGTDLSAPRPSSWLWVAAMVALPGTGHLMTNFAHAYIRMSIMSVLTLLTPGLSALAAWVLLDERIVLVQILGMVITIGALAMMVRPPRRVARPSAAVR